MPSQSQLQQKLAAVSKKLKIVCQSYAKLKEQARGKDQEILKLKQEICRLMESEEVKENRKYGEIRRKYQGDGTFRPGFRGGIEDCDTRYLKNSKSLSSQQFAKPLQQLSETPKHTPKPTQPSSTPIPHLSPFLTHPTHPPTLSPLSPLSPTPPKPSLPSSIDLQKSKSPPQFLQIDNKYAKDLDLKQPQTQAEMLKELWEERDREIKRMDELFQNLNKRIYG